VLLGSIGDVVDVRGGVVVVADDICEDNKDEADDDDDGDKEDVNADDAEYIGGSCC
jgi:hypothetical protein